MADDGELIEQAQLGRPLRERRRRLPRLSVAEWQRVVDTFLVLVEGLYTHLPLKQAMYGIDPVQRLRLLRQRVDAGDVTGVVDDVAFHHELAGIMTGLRDAHTRYIGPTRLAGETAMLPFLVEAYGSPAAPRYVVSKVASGPARSLVDDPRFVEGVELVSWNAVPIDRAVEIHAEQETGGRPDSRRARALETLTLRSLQFGRPPDEMWVDVGYRDPDDDPGVEREVRIEWRVVSPRRARTAARPDRTGRAEMERAIDPAAEATRRTKKLLFAPEPWLADHRGPATGSGPTDGEWIETPFQDAVSAKPVATSSGRFGYLRLWSFDVADDQRYVKEVVRLLGLLPDRGLIVDLRANPGGSIWAAERLLQLLTPHPVVPTRFSMRATSLTRAMAAAPQNQHTLAPWRRSLDQAVTTGELYSRAVPITAVERCNDIGQVYSGPVVAVVDPNTYSAGDLFAAGFVDNQVGTLVSVGTATGGGGANVWLHEQVVDALTGAGLPPDPLPAGISYTLAVRRATRAVDAEGTAIEDLGVSGHRTYQMRKDDLVDGNRGLHNLCGRILRAAGSRTP